MDSRSPIRVHWLDRLIVRVAPWREYRSVRIVVVTMGDTLNDALFAKVCAAIDVVAGTVPAQFHRIPRFMNGIIVDNLPESIVGRWHPSGICIVAKAFVASATSAPVDIASIIIHELTHARLERAGFTYNSLTRARHEHICLLAQRNFARQLADAETRERLERSIAGDLAIDPSFWSDEASDERMRASRAAMPVWRRLWSDVGLAIGRFVRRVT